MGRQTRSGARMSVKVEPCRPSSPDFTAGMVYLGKLGWKAVAFASPCSELFVAF